MSHSDPQRQFAVEVVERLKQAGFQALWAGGCVRDFLIGRTPKDYDVATDAHPEQVREIFGKRRTHAVGASFGVILVRGPKAAGDVEVATFRSEGPYADGRRPDHVTFTTAEEDAHRRDFTINGMFYDPVAQQVLDYVGGEQDISAQLIRAIGDPHDRMREDKLRMLRAVRFAATMEFELDSLTAEAIREMADEIHVVSAERIAQELKRMLVDPHRRRAMQLCLDVDLLPLIFPELPAMIGLPVEAEPTTGWQSTLKMLQLLQEPGFELATAVLLHTVPATPRASAGEAVRAICKRLRLSNHETDRIGWLVENQRALIEAPTLPLAKLKRLLAQPLIDDLLAFTRVKTLAENGDLGPIVFCEEYLASTPADQINPPLLLTGDDLIALGVVRGPIFKEILETVRDAQLNDEIITADEARGLAARLQADA